MDQDVHASRVPDEIPGHAGIAGQHHRAPEMVHAVAEGRFDRRVVDLERRDLQPASIEHYALLDVPGADHDAFRRCTIFRHPEPDMERVCLLAVGPPVQSAARPPAINGAIASRTDTPTGRPESRAATPTSGK